MRRRIKIQSRDILHPCLRLAQSLCASIPTLPLLLPLPPFKRRRTLSFCRHHHRFRGIERKEQPIVPITSSSSSSHTRTFSRLSPLASLSSSDSFFPSSFSDSLPCSLADSPAIASKPFHCHTHSHAVEDAGTAYAAVAGILTLAPSRPPPPHLTCTHAPQTSARVPIII